MKDLGAFYDRLLLEIDPLHSEQALTMLRWIAFSPHLLTLAQLAECLQSTLNLTSLLTRMTDSWIPFLSWKFSRPV